MRCGVGIAQAPTVDAGCQNSNRPQCGVVVKRLFIAIGNLFWDNRLHTSRLLDKRDWGMELGPHSPITCPSPGLCHEPGKKDGDFNSIPETRIGIGDWKRPTIPFVPCRTLWRRNGPGRLPPPPRLFVSFASHWRHTSDFFSDHDRLTKANRRPSSYMNKSLPTLPTHGHHSSSPTLLHNDGL